MLGTSGSPVQFKNFMKNILIFVKHEKEALNAFGSVVK